MIEVRIPQPVLEGLLVAVERRGHRTVAVCGAGTARVEDRLLVVYRSVSAYVRDGGVGIQRALAQGLVPLLVWRANGFPAAGACERWVGELNRAGAKTAVVLGFVETGADLIPFGFAVDQGEVRAVDQLSLPGPGMFKVAVRSFWERADEVETREQAVGVGSQERAVGTDRASRYQLALGDGDAERGGEILRRAAELSVAQVGCGRMGETVGWRLAQGGVGWLGGVSLCDEDVVQEHNLGVLLPPQAVGMYKAEAVSAFLHAMVPGCRIRPVVGMLPDRAVTEAVMCSDVAVTCVDDDVARLGVAALCSRCGVVHLDLAGGAAYTRSRRVAFGGDVILAVPGCRGCLGCTEDWNWGEVSRRLDESAEAARLRREQRVWHRERGGSWVDVLLPVVGEGVQELLRLVQGKRRGSMWLHYSHGQRHRAMWEDWSYKWASRSERCPLCSERGVRGLGDLDL